MLLWLSQVKSTLSGKDRPGDSCELVGERDDNLVTVYPLRFHSVYPDPKVVLRPVEMQDTGTSAVNKQLAQIWIPTLADTEEALLPSR